LPQRGSGLTIIQLELELEHKRMTELFNEQLINDTHKNMNKRTWPVYFRLPLYTFPYEPSPIRSRTW